MQANTQTNNHTVAVGKVRKPNYFKPATTTVRMPKEIALLITETDDLDSIDGALWGKLEDAAMNHATAKGEITLSLEQQELDSLSEALDALLFRGAIQRRDVLMFSEYSGQ